MLVVKGHGRTKTVGSEAQVTGWKEGREARKVGRPRQSPYEGIRALRSFHQPWLDGWDAMDVILKREGK